LDHYAELQKASALVPALKSNWLMMHVSVMMLSYATLLVGSLSCMSFLLVDASQGWSGAKSTLGFLDKLVSGGGGGDAAAEGEEASAVVVGAGDAMAVTAMASSSTEMKVRQRNRPQVVEEGSTVGLYTLSSVHP
jgi:hypothetical protein